MSAATTLHKRGKVSQQSVFPFSRSLVSQSFLESCKTWALEKGKTATSDDGRSGGQAENWKSSLGKQRERASTSKLHLFKHSRHDHNYQYILGEITKPISICHNNGIVVAVPVLQHEFFGLCAGCCWPTETENLPWVNFRWHRKKWAWKTGRPWSSGAEGCCIRTMLGIILGSWGLFDK